MLGSKEKAAGQFVRSYLAPFPVLTLFPGFNPLTLVLAPCSIIRIEI